MNDDASRLPGVSYCVINETAALSSVQNSNCCLKHCHHSNVFQVSSEQWATGFTHPIDCPKYLQIANKGILMRWIQKLYFQSATMSPLIRQNKTYAPCAEFMSEYRLRNRCLYRHYVDTHSQASVGLWLQDCKILIAFLFGGLHLDLKSIPKNRIWLRIGLHHTSNFCNPIRIAILSWDN